MWGLQEITCIGIASVTGHHVSSVGRSVALPRKRSRVHECIYSGVSPVYLSRLLHTYKPKRDLISTLVANLAQVQT